MKIVPAINSDEIKRSVRYWDKAGTADGGAFTVGALMHWLYDGRFVKRCRCRNTLCRTTASLRHFCPRACERRPVARALVGTAARPISFFSARAIASSTSFSAPCTSSHFTIVTHLPFSRSL